MKKRMLLLNPNLAYVGRRRKKQFWVVLLIECGSIMYQSVKTKAVYECDWDDFIMEDLEFYFGELGAAFVESL